MQKQKLNSIELPSFVQDIIDEGVEISIRRDDKYGYVFDLNTEAKSHMYLYKMGIEWCVSLRYNEDYVVNSFDEIVYYANYCKHGRDFINPMWQKIINKYRGKQNAVHN